MTFCFRWYWYSSPHCFIWEFCIRSWEIIGVYHLMSIMQWTIYQRARDTIYTILTSVQLGPWWCQATSHCLSQYICSNVGILKLMFTWKCFQLCLPMNIWTTLISKTWFSHINSNYVFLLKLNYIGFSWIIVTLTLAISSVTLRWHGGNGNCNDSLYGEY